MNVVRLRGDGIFSNSIRCSSRCTFLNFQLKRNFSRVLISLIVVHILGTNLFPQNSTLFDVRSVIRDVRIRFNLGPADEHRVGPAIQKEYQDVLLIYSRFAENEIEYPINLWRVIIGRRIDFESRIQAGFNRRQIAALRSARTALERRVLNFLVEDYINFLADFLDLDSLQLEATGAVLSAESRRKHQMIIKGLLKPATLQPGLDKLSNDTESIIKVIFTPDQYHEYRLMCSSVTNPVG